MLYVLCAYVYNKHKHIMKVFNERVAVTLYGFYASISFAERQERGGDDERLFRSVVFGGVNADACCFL